MLAANLPVSKANSSGSFYPQRFVWLTEDLICKKNLSRSNGVTITNKISSASVNDITEHLSHSLEELDVMETRISTEKLLELRSMPKLRILNCSNPPITLYKQLPNLGINHGHLKIADSDESYKPQDGFWEIKVKQSCVPEANPHYNFPISVSNYKTKHGNYIRICI